jgi:hypothetical protein
VVVGQQRFPLVQEAAIAQRRFLADLALVAGRALVAIAQRHFLADLALATDQALAAIGRRRFRVGLALATGLALVTDRRLSQGSVIVPTDRVVVTGQTARVGAIGHGMALGLVSQIGGTISTPN